MGIEIREVKTKRDLRRFIDFGNELYSNCDNYCPPFYMDEEAVFDRKKNPAYDVSESVEYLAYDDGKIVGRICGIVNRRANEHWKVKKVRFGWFDFIDDERVSRALLDKVVAWGKERGMEVLNGPVGFTDLDHEGLLIEGYEYLAPVASLYNYPYYERHYENYGLTKENDWIEFQITPPDEMPERVARISKLVAERSHLHVDKIHNKNELLKKYKYTFFDLIDECYSSLYNFQPLTQRQKEYYSNYYFSILNFDFVSIIANEKDEIVGLGVSMPDISDALRRSGGKLLPLGWYHLLKALTAKHYDAIDMLIIAVRPDYQGKGVNSLILAEQYPYFKKYGVTRVETTSIMETNWKNQANWELFPNKQHKRRRAYIKNI
ncbi:MAG: N-acetyltransferase [Paludibacteraceae bacterium]|nr:N-acetyltransferase [Paludibacteraceae bacterium]